MEGPSVLPDEMKYKYWSLSGSEEGFCEESCLCLYPPLDSESKKEDWASCLKVFVFWVIVIEVLVHIAACFASESSVGMFLVPDFNTTLMGFGAFQSEKVFKKHQYWRLISTCFLHSDLIHLWSNVFPQIFFCLGLSRRWSWKIIPIYMIPGILGSAMTSMFKPLTMAGVGASGNTYGMAGAYSIMIFFFWAKIPSNQVWSVSAWPIYFLVWYGIYELMPGAGNYTHFFGIIAGILSASVFFAEERFSGTIAMICKWGSAFLLFLMLLVPILYHNL